ncbi:hypothetical protein BDZ91DRAFT_729783 [Kalaharituber pfeilii]|nr:hypothetical protein BDZ91DRAFT_729783 [Kalaharituber pfeilii]
MEALVSATSTASRDILTEELTNLKSLLRLNADGVGDEADLVHQLNQTRAAIDQFCAVLSERRDLLVTPESLGPNSPTSSVATSPRLSLDSLPSWSSSQTSQLSSIEGEMAKSVGAGRDTAICRLESAKNVDSGAKVESWNCELDSPMGEGLQGSDDEGLEDRVSDFDDDADDVEEESMGVQDETFKRLSTLLLSLQAQAEAAVSNPAAPLDDDAIPEETNGVEEYQFPAAILPTGTKRKSIIGGGRSMSPRPDYLRASFRRSKSLPYRPSSLSLFTPSDESKPSPLQNECDIPITGENTPLSPDSANKQFPEPGTLHRRVTSASLLSLPSRRMSRSATPTACPSPRSLSISRRGSSLIKDMGIESLLGDLIETANRANQTALENQGFMMWVWTLLAGGGVLWLAVGWALKWNCHCPSPTSAS